MEFSGLLEVSGILIICLAFPNVPLFQDCFKICFFWGGGICCHVMALSGFFHFLPRWGFFGDFEKNFCQDLSEISSAFFFCYSFNIFEHSVLRLNGTFNEVMVTFGRYGRYLTGSPHSEARNEPRVDVSPDGTAAASGGAAPGAIGRGAANQTRQKMETKMKTKKMTMKDCFMERWRGFDYLFPARWSAHFH